MSSGFAKVRAFVEVLQENDDLDSTAKFDQCKCRKNRMYYSEYDWPVYNVMDNPQPYTGEPL